MSLHPLVVKHTLGTHTTEGMAVLCSVWLHTMGVGAWVAKCRPPPLGLKHGAQSHLSRRDTNQGSGRHGAAMVRVPLAMGQPRGPVRSHLGFLDGSVAPACQINAELLPGLTQDSPQAPNHEAPAALDE